MIEEGTGHHGSAKKNNKPALWGKKGGLTEKQERKVKLPGDV